jgi:hypothetical protein
MGRTCGIVDSKSEFPTLNIDPSNNRITKVNVVLNVTPCSLVECCIHFLGKYNTKEESLKNCTGKRSALLAGRLPGTPFHLGAVGSAFL